MKEHNKDFYVWTMEECIKTTYEWWGIDIMSIYNYIKEDFPNATQGIRNIYTSFEDSNFYEAMPLAFEEPQFVYEAISSLIPMDKILRYDMRTKEQSSEYKNLNLCPWKSFVQIRRMDLLMAVLLFTEEFILEPITAKNVVFTDQKLTVYGNFLTLKVSKHEDVTYITIRVRNVILLEYVIQTSGKNED